MADPIVKDDPLAKVDLPSTGYDIRAFRSYCEKKNVPPIRPNSIRVFFMGQGRVSQAVEISLEDGRCEIWPDVFEKTESKVMDRDWSTKVRLSRVLVREELNQIPSRPNHISADGVCHLLEIQDEDGYSWWLHRNSKSGYFRALVGMVDLISELALPGIEEWEEANKSEMATPRKPSD